MDADALLRPVPDDDALRELTGAQRKAMAEALVERILDAFVADKRMPDAWQSALLSAAIGAISGHFYMASIHYCRILLTAGGRNRHELGASSVATSIVQLRESLERAKATPPRDSAPTARP
jgi:hypothetical protein